MTNIDGSPGGVAPASGDFVKNNQQTLTALDGLFATHEIRVLGLVGILTGYISILFVKMMGLLSPLIGVGGIVLITLMLMLLDPQINPRSTRWWLRALSVVIMSIVITSPQMFDAWSVAVREARNEALFQLTQPNQSLPEVRGTGTITKDH